MGMGDVAHRWTADPLGASAEPPLVVLHQGADWLAVHKPSGWLVHRTALDAAERRVVLQALRDQIGQPVYPVHRLDKGTSGVLVFALHPSSAREWTARFTDRSLSKRYLALVRGWPAREFAVDHPLRQEDAGPNAALQGAVTHFRRLATLQIDEPLAGYPSVRAALVEARPLTGRRHQIRRHLKHAAHPVIGDATHGKGVHNRWWAERLGLTRLWLHAWQLEGAAAASADLPCITSGLDEAFNADWHRLLAWPQWRWDDDEASPHCTICEPGS